MQRKIPLLSLSLLTSVSSPGPLRSEPVGDLDIHPGSPQSQNVLDLIDSDLQLYRSDQLLAPLCSTST